MIKKARIVGCFLEYKGKFIILQRAEHDSHAGSYGLPAGGIAEGETNTQAILREIREETGYHAEEKELIYLGTWSWQYPERIMDFVTYKIMLKKSFQVILDKNEHQSFKWVTPEECYKIKNLIHGFHDLLKLVGYIKDETK
jgi:mutator protein MutT